MNANNRCSGESCAQGEHRELHLTLAMGQSFDDLVLQTPADLFECLFEGDGETLSRLAGQVVLTGAGFRTEDTGSVNVRVDCAGWPDGTTTTSTTTSTLPCDGGACEAGDVIPVRIWLDDAVSLGALQLDITFSSLIGGFEQYEASAAKCTLQPGVNALFATNQIPRLDNPDCHGCARRLILGFAFRVDHAGPGPLATCSFVVGEQPPTNDEFAVRIVDATTANGTLIDPPPAISLRGIGD